MMKTIVGCCVFLASIPATAQWKKYSFQQPKMGSLFNLVIFSTDSLEAARAAAAAYRYIDTLNLIFSDYLPNSELNQLCAQSGNQQWTKVSEPLFHIIQTAKQAARLSKGSFDITAGPLTRLWRTARKNGALPTDSAIRTARERTGYRYINLNAQTNSIRLRKKDMQLDLGGIAKGETSQRVIDRLKAQGYPYALIDAGGDIVCSDTPPGAASWSVVINNPGAESVMANPLRLRNASVTTSGDLYQHLLIGGRRYSHIIDPRTGNALTNSVNVTVIAQTGVVADWLTKACSLLPVQQAFRLVRRFHGAEVQIAELVDNKPVYHRSTGFAKYLSLPTASAPAN